MTAIADSSIRFILPEDAPYLRNLSALWAQDPAIARQIEALPEDSSYPIEPTKTGEITVQVPGPSGRAIYLHSRHAPSDEAKRLAAAVPVDAKVCFYIYGFGLGYHIEQLFDRASDEAIFIVFEPDLKIIRTAFEHRDLSRLIDDGRLIFITRDDKPAMFERLEAQMSLLALGSETLIHPASKQLHEKFFDRMQVLVGELTSYVQTSLNTLVLNGRKTAENVALNSGWYAAARGMSHLTGRYQGKPAIIVSAGPSLRKNKHLLKDIQGKAIIIAVQTTLQPLLEMGIEPQFVTSLDYHEICSRFFEKLPPRLSTQLVAEAKATTAVFKLHPGPLALCGNDFADRLLREMKLDRPRIRAGATVAHLAYYLAEHLLCDPIIFIGQDLGFSDGLCYSPGTSYEDVWRPELSRFCTVEMKQWEQIARDRPILRQIPDYVGRPMYTEDRLLAYLHQFEVDFAQSKHTLIDATEGGAFKRGTRAMRLADAAEKYCTQPIEFANDPVALDWSVLPSVIDCLTHRREEGEQIEQISRKTLPLLQEIIDHIQDQSRVNRAIAQIDALHAKMNDLGSCYDLVMELSQTTELHRFHADRKIKASRVSGNELQRRQVKRDIENVRAVADAAKDFQTMIGSVIEDLSRRPG